MSTRVSLERPRLDRGGGRALRTLSCALHYPTDFRIRSIRPTFKESSMSAQTRRTGPVNMGYLESTVGYSIRRAQIAVFQDIYAAFDDKAITLTQFSVLAVVADNPEITQSELAAALAVERPRIVPLLNALEQRNLAQRVVCEDDKRNRRIVLTPQGRALLKDLKEHG